MATYSLNFGAFYGGISDDAYIGVQGQVQEARFVDVRSDLRGVKLAKVGVKVPSNSDTTIAVDIRKILPYNISGVSLEGGVLCFGDGGKVYRYNSFTSVLSDVYTYASLAPIYNAIAYQNRVWFVCGNKLGNIALADVDDSPWTTVNTAPWVEETLATTSQICPMCVAQGKLYIGNGSNLAEYDEATKVMTTQKIVVDTTEEITGITTRGNLLFIYTRDKANNPTACTRGNKYVWDFVSSLPTYKAEFQQKPIHQVHVAPDSSYDYVIAGNGTSNELNSLGIYASQAYDLQLVKKFPKGDTFIEGNYNGWMWTANDVLHVANILYDAATTGQASVFSYGSRTPQIPGTSSMVNEFLTEGFDNDTQITAGSFSPSIIYLFSKQNSLAGGRGLFQVSTKYINTGYIQSLVFDGGEGWREKAIREIRLFFDRTATDTIVLSVRTNTNNAWTLISTISGAIANGNDRGTRIYPSEFPSNLNTFNTLEIQIELISTTGTTSPIFRNATVIYDSLED